MELNMKEKIDAIAERLRSLREIEDISVEEMAEVTGKTPDECRLYENGEKEFSFSFLFTAANKLNVDITDLITGESTRLHTFSKVKYGKGLAMERRRAYKYQHLAPIFKNRKMEPFLVTVEPNDVESAVAKHAHEGHEINYVTRGKMMFYIDNNETELEEGDLLYFDATRPHAMKALDGKKCQFLAIISK